MVACGQRRVDGRQRWDATMAALNNGVGGTLESQRRLDADVKRKGTISLASEDFGNKGQAKTNFLL